MGESTHDEMLAAILHGREDLRLERVPRPRAAAGELIVRVQAALTCGTDLKVYRRGYHAAMLRPPMLFGHELGGVVGEVGAGVAGFQVGDRVVPMNSAPCGTCFWCGRHQENLCADLLFNNGAYAEWLRVPARIVESNTLRVPDELPLEHAAMTEPLACVVRGLEECGLGSTLLPGDSLAVLGAGPIGLMFVHAASLAGVRVIAVVKRAAQRQAALRFGAAEVVELGEGVDAVQAVRALTPGSRGVDVAIDAVATPLTWEWAVAMARRGGLVNFFGGPPAGTVVALDTNRLHYGEITLKASFHHTPATCRRALAMIAGGRFDCAGLITGSARLDQVPEVFEHMLMRRADGPVEVKTAIFPGQVAL